MDFFCSGPGADFLLSYESSQNVSKTETKLKSTQELWLMKSRPNAVFIIMGIQIKLMYENVLLAKNTLKEATQLWTQINLNQI